MLGVCSGAWQRPLLPAVGWARAQPADGSPGQGSRAYRVAELIKSDVDCASATNFSLTIWATALSAITTITPSAALQSGATAAAPLPAATASSVLSAAGSAAAARAFPDR